MFGRIYVGLNKEESFCLFYLLVMRAEIGRKGAISQPPSHNLHLCHIALCCYPNVNGAIRNLSLNAPTATIFLQFNYFRENIWVRIWVQFHLLYIFVGRLDKKYKTSHIPMLSFYFSPSDLQSFGDELNKSSKTAPANI